MVRGKEIYLCSPAVPFSKHFLGHKPMSMGLKHWPTNYNLENKGVSAGTCNHKHFANMHLALVGQVQTCEPRS